MHMEKKMRNNYGVRLDNVLISDCRSTRIKEKREGRRDERGSKRRIVWWKRTIIGLRKKLVHEGIQIPQRKTGRNRRRKKHFHW